MRLHPPSVSDSNGGTSKGVPANPLARDLVKGRGFPRPVNLIR